MHNAKLMNHLKQGRTCENCEFATDSDRRARLLNMSLYKVPVKILDLYYSVASLFWFKLILSQIWLIMEIQDCGLSPDLMPS